MGAFNTVTFKWTDPDTGATRDLVVQFRYGDTWQHEYRLGDVLSWGKNDDLGLRNARRVVVDGYLNDVSPPPGVPSDFEVYIVNGRIDEVVPATGEFDFVHNDDTYIVLDK
jgi:hypothetical protein